MWPHGRFLRHFRCNFFPNSYRFRSQFVPISFHLLLNFMLIFGCWGLLGIPPGLLGVAWASAGVPWASRDLLDVSGGFLGSPDCLLGPGLSWAPLRAPGPRSSRIPLDPAGDPQETPRDLEETPGDPKSPRRPQKSPGDRQETSAERDRQGIKRKLSESKITSDQGIFHVRPGNPRKPKETPHDRGCCGCESRSSPGRPSTGPPMWVPPWGPSPGGSPPGRPPTGHPQDTPEDTLGRGLGDCLGDCFVDTFGGHIKTIICPHR